MQCRKKQERLRTLSKLAERKPKFQIGFASWMHMCYSKFLSISRLVVIDSIIFRPFGHFGNNININYNYFLDLCNVAKICKHLERLAIKMLKKKIGTGYIYRVGNVSDASELSKLMTTFKGVVHISPSTLTVKENCLCFKLSLK